MENSTKSGGEQKMRIKKHPILNFQRGKEINFTFDGELIKAYQGETIVSALHAVGIKELSRSKKLDRPRGLFCAIGKCSSCLMTVNGIPNVKGCVTLAEDGMNIKSQRGKGKLDTGKINPKLGKPSEKLEAKLAIVGSGPAGLSATQTAIRLDISPLLIDENPKGGGQLVKQTHKFFGSKKQDAGIRGVDIAKDLQEEIKSSELGILTKTTVLGLYKPQKNQNFTLALNNNGRLIEVKTHAVIISTGALEKTLTFPNNDLPGIYGAGAVQTFMNQYGIKPGQKALMVGAGNVGLIVSYQLLQAGVEVEEVVEAMPKIGGYQVHASKLTRFGVPILTSHTTKKALGEDQVQGAVISQLDENWEAIPESEREVEVDIICLAVGLTPSIKLACQAGCQCTWISELGGQVPLHNQNLQTTVKGIYIAGDSAGIGEASTAMIEGKIACLSALTDIGEKETKTTELRSEAFQELDNLRAGPFGQMPRKGKVKIFRKYEEVMK